MKTLCSKLCLTHDKNEQKRAQQNDPSVTVDGVTDWLTHWIGWLPNERSSVCWGIPQCVLIRRSRKLPAHPISLGSEHSDIYMQMHTHTHTHTHTHGRAYHILPLYNSVLVCKVMIELRLQSRWKKHWLGNRSWERPTRGEENKLKFEYFFIVCKWTPVPELFIHRPLIEYDLWLYVLCYSQSIFIQNIEFSFTYTDASSVFETVTWKVERYNLADWTE
jgi:hypothetical protein